MKWNWFADLCSDMVQPDSCQTMMDFEAILEEVKEEIEDEAVRIEL